MPNIRGPLFQELRHAADSDDIRDQLSVLFRREVAEDLVKMEDYRRLSNMLRNDVEMRDGYISKLEQSNTLDEVVESVKILKRMQVDDMQKASRLMLMAREMQDQVYEKNNFITKLRG
ncbi:hypothetical protein Tco_0850436 [Tanacetum coccineum]